MQVGVMLNLKSKIPLIVTHTHEFDLTIPNCLTASSSIGTIGWGWG